MKYGYNLWTSSREVRNAMRSDPEFAVPDAQGQSRVVFSQASLASKVETCGLSR